MGACACGAHAPHDKIMIYAGGCIAAEKEGKMKNDVKGAYMVIFDHSGE